MLHAIPENRLDSVTVAKTERRGDYLNAGLLKLNFIEYPAIHTNYS